MRTFLISYDLANPAQNKHAIAQSIMSAGERWARPLESTWYLTSSADEASLAERFGPLLDTDDGLLIQSVDDQAVLTNLHVDMDYDQVNAQTPARVHPAFAGSADRPLRGWREFDEGTPLDQAVELATETRRCLATPEDRPLRDLTLPQ